MEGTLASGQAKVEGVRWVSPEENDGGVKRGISRDGHSGGVGSSSGSHSMEVGYNVRTMVGDVAERIR